ncbi:MAG: TonB-dependent receptor [Chitinophagaceae bacterium]|nr:TonB-dependent receptor [Chitinophagaceae bacterium]
MRRFKRLPGGIAVLATAIFLLSANAIFAQTRTVSGAVTDSKTSAPLPGATISVKGTRTSTTANDQGKFSIGAGSNAILVISSIGYKTLEVKTGAQNEIDIKLENEGTQLSDVVVVGFGTRKKGSLTGAISTVDAKTFQNRGPIASPVAALQGQVPGVTITRSSSQPGREAWNFLVRGNSSVNGAEPLVIVDGLTLPNSSALNSFNPADIDNISFLKDAAASSIYGARAAGGVVIITTKRAKSGRAVIEYNGSVSKKIIGLQPKLTDVYGWGPMMAEVRTTDGFAATDLWYRYGKLMEYATQNGKTVLTNTEAADALSGLGLSNTGFFTDVKDFAFFPGTMQDYLWGGATSNEHQLSVSSRGERSGYRISLGYLDDGSLLKVGNNSNKRYNVRLTHDYQISSKLKLESNISLEKNDIIQPSNIGAVLNNGIQPGLPPSGVGATGLPYVWGSGIGNASTVAIANFGGDAKEYNARINTNFNLTYNIISNLKAVASAGYYFHNTDYRTQENLINWYDYAGTTLVSSLSPSGSGRSFYQRAARRESYYNANAYLEYSKVFAGDHDFRAMAGTQYERDEYNAFQARTLDVVPGVPPSLNSSYGDPTTKTVGEAQNHYALAGYFGRLNYTFRNKYLFEINGRYDGSSKFDADNRWKLFYGLSGGWRISQEQFMENVGFINDLKLRASWGNVGNQNGIGLYDYIQLLNLGFSPGATNAGYPIIGSAPAVRVTPGGLVALDRTWERVQTTNLGLDFTVLNNRLSGSAEMFWKQNDNMLIARTFPAVLGANAPAGNNGKLNAKGWEASLNWSDVIGKLRYRIGGNLSFYSTKLVNFGGQKIISSNNRGMNSAVEGYPLNAFFGLVYDGRIQTEKELDDYRTFITGNNIGMPSGAANAQANGRLALGDNMFKDVNGDGKITFPEDAVYLGTNDPRITYAFNGGIDWNGFDFSVIFQGVGKRTIIRDGNWRIPGAVVYQAQNEAFVNQWWTPERTDAWLPRVSSTGTINNYNYYPSDWVAENGAYIRLKNIVIGYTLPATLTKRAGIEKFRIYFSGNDLWEHSKIRDGWDPEASRNVANTGDGNNNNQSTFSDRYPFYRYLTFGVNVTF